MKDGAALLEILTSKDGETEAGMRREMEAPAVQSSGQEHGPCNPTSWIVVMVQLLASDAHSEK